MIDYRVLNKLGSTDQRLREILTASMPEDVSEKEKEKIEKDIASREKIEKWCRGRLDEHIFESIRNYTLYSAPDLMWDSMPINKEQIPLIKYAQGKIDAAACAKTLESLGLTQYIQRDANQAPTGINLENFFKFNVNIGRSIITRRLAAQANKYCNLWPYYKYDPRGESPTDKLRADAMSQRSDIMADQYGYRHHDIQWMRDAMMYGWSLDFVRCGWDKTQSLRVVGNPENVKDEDLNTESFIVKEGVQFVNPHPTRVFWDNAYPLSSINEDIGCKYIGFWDVVRYREIADNNAYYNLDVVTWNENFWTTLASCDYSNDYLCNVNPPCSRAPGDLAAPNDAKGRVGLYAGDKEDSSVLLAQMFKKVVPHEIGWGTYTQPVWVRLVVAGDTGKVIFNETLPSTPAAYIGINQNEQRAVSLSLAHEIMPFQDQMSNLATQMLLLARAEILKIYDIDSSGLTEDQQNAVMAKLGGKDWGMEPVFIVRDHSKMDEMGLKNGNRVQITETKVSGSMTAILRAMAELVVMAERMLSMSPAEQGQPAPRELSATEINAISNTTESVYSFISDSFDEGRAAKKRIIYESLMAKAQDEQVLPVQQKYTRQTIERAGFKVHPDYGDASNLPGEPSRFTIVGNKKNLISEYIFTSRDGSERTSNTASANVLMQLLTAILQFPGMAEAFGKERVFEIINEIFRLSGVGYSPNISVQEGEDPSFNPPEFQQLMEMVQQTMSAVQGNTADIESIKGILPQLGQLVEGAMQNQQAVDTSNTSVAPPLV
jgi:hypothetical protein